METSEIMKTAGEITARVFGDEDIPKTTLHYLLYSPIKGLGMIANLTQTRAADQEELARLFAKIPADWKHPNGTVPSSQQMPFWTGYYKYRVTQKEFHSFNRDKLQEYGTLLFGDTWQSSMARSLNVDPRTIRYWLSGERKIPFGAYLEILALMKQKQIEIEGKLQELHTADPVQKAV